MQVSHSERRPEVENKQLVGGALHETCKQLKHPEQFDKYAEACDLLVVDRVCVVRAVEKDWLRFGLLKVGATCDRFILKFWHMLRYVKEVNGIMALVWIQS